MVRTFVRVVSALLPLVGGSQTYAAEDLPLIDIPREYIQPGPQLERANPDRESAQAIDGRSYTILTPILDGSEGNESYVRFYNTNTSLPVVVTVTVVGTKSAHVYGSAYVTVPAMASPQYHFRQIINAAGFISYVSGDTGFSFYLRSSHDNTLFQHVGYNASTRFFENLSVCTWDEGRTYVGMSRFIGNVHTSNIYMTEYPSAIVLHHYGTTTARYSARLYRATDGAFLGGMTFNMFANETFVAPVTFYEQTINWRPTDLESHVNIVFDRDDGFTFTGMAGHAVYNARLNAYLNMSQFCGINKTF
jgi:hypothetical protein